MGSGSKRPAHLPSPNPRKSLANLQQGTIKPRNTIERIFYERFGTVTPIPEQTMRRKNCYIMAAISYIHHNKTLSEIVKIHNIESEDFLGRVANEDKWEKFRHQLAQLARPSALALFETLDIDRIEVERKRRLDSVDKLVAIEEQIIEALKKIPAGTKAMTEAVGCIEKIRKLNAGSMGLDYHDTEQHAARSTALIAAAKKLIHEEDNPIAKLDNSTILDI